MSKKDDGPKAKYSQLFPYLKEHKGQLGLAVVLSLIGAVASLAQPMVVGQIITAVTDDKPLGTIILALVGITLASAVTSGFMYFVLARAGSSLLECKIAYLATG